MSIFGAVTELNKEIERLTKIRDSLLQGSSESGAARAVTAPATKSAAAKKSSPAKKRRLSAAGRKRISEAAKARWAAKKKSAPSK